ncbi:hypothetical protein [Corynebacterium poyangense]|uniref:hypothetical protein n=1 Tax=Corynebacterium poyangense TaxID=2684405 RepID=UPI001CCCB387|nr:hypothetical protein [Corynebacterium poyangense]
MSNQDWGYQPQHTQQFPQGQFQDQWDNQWSEDAEDASSSSNRGLIIGLGVIAVLLFLFILGSAAYLFMGTSSQSQDNASSASSSSTSSTNKASETATTQKSTGRPQHPSIPAGSRAVNDAARNNEPAGNFNNVYAGTNVTSNPFALAVRDAYAQNFTEHHQYDAVLNVRSSVTGITYRMDCHDNGQYVTCTGGDNAVVYIS